MAKQLVRVPRVMEVWSLNPLLAKSYTVLRMVRHCFNIYASSCIALGLWCRGGHLKLITCFSVIRQV